jgi:hypothetical protein
MEATPAFRTAWNSFAPSWWLTRIVVAEAMPQLIIHVTQEMVMAI